MQAVLLSEVPAAVTLLLCALPALLHGAAVNTHSGGDLDLSSAEDLDLNPQGQVDDGYRPYQAEPPNHRRRQLHSQSAEDGDRTPSSLESSEENDDGVDMGARGRRVKKGCVGCAKERQRRRLERGVENDAERLKQMRLDIIKQQILDRLGLKQPPNITRNLPRPAIPEPLLRDMDTVPVYSPEDDDDQSKPTEIITFATPISTCRSQRPSGCYHFQFQEDLNMELVDSAELWVYKLQDPSSTSNHTLVVNELDRHYHATNRHESRLYGRQAQIQRGWVKFDVRHLVRRWLRRPTSNHGLIVTCPTCEADPEAVPIANRDEHRVYILLHMGKPRKRTRRSTKIDCEGPTDQCCRDTLRVNFDDIGWGNWVMQPTSYNAYYCRGPCEEVQLGTYPHSTVFQLMVKLGQDNQRGEELALCCSPTELSSMSMIYMDEDGNIMKQDLNRMVVEKCGCS